MIQIKSKVIIVSFFLLLIVACTRRPMHNQFSASPAPDALAKYDTAASMLVRTGFSPCVYDSVLVLMDEAIEMDSSFLAAYGRKMEILGSIGDKDGVGSTIKDLRSVIKDNFEVETLTGFYFDKIQQKDSAEIHYLKSIALRDEYLKMRDTSAFRRANVAYGRVMLIKFIGNEKEFKRELKKAKMKYKDIGLNWEFLDTLITRDKFINDLWWSESDLRRYELQHKH